MRAAGQVYARPAWLAHVAPAASGAAVTPRAATSPLTSFPTDRLPDRRRGEPAGKDESSKGPRMPPPHSYETHSSGRSAAVGAARRAWPCGCKRSRPSPAAGGPHLPSGCRPSGGEGRRSVHSTRRARRAVLSGATGACRPHTRARRTLLMSSRKSDVLPPLSNLFSDGP